MTTFSLRVVICVVAICGAALSVTSLLARHQEGRIETYDLTGKVRVCPVHHVEMLVERVPAVHARVSLDWSAEAIYAVQEVFPFANREPVAGVEHKWVMVRYCPHCREAQRRWSRRTRAWQSERMRENLDSRKASLRGGHER